MVHFLEHLVFKGAGDMSARDIVERIEAEGGTINASTGYERTHFDIRGLEGSLPLALQVLSDLLFRPTLDAAEVEREKDVVAQEIAETSTRTTTCSRWPRPAPSPVSLSAAPSSDRWPA